MTSRHVLTAFAAATLICLPTESASAGAWEDIHSASAAGRTVFVAVADGPGPGMDAARATAQRAQALAPQSALVELDRRDAAHAAAVERLGLARADVPMVLLI